MIYRLQRAFVRGGQGGQKGSSEGSIGPRAGEIYRVRGPMGAGVGRSIGSMETHDRNRLLQGPEGIYGGGFGGREEALGLGRQKQDLQGL